MSVTEAAASADKTAKAVARAFTAARLAMRSLPDFPGEAPQTLAPAYAIQEAAISLWPDRIVGWKVGFIPKPFQERLGSNRVAGPIFSKDLRHNRRGQVTSFPVFDGGFAAVEGEFVYRLGEDAPADRMAWTAHDALSLIDALFIGVETAGSPLATINQLGPTVVASDFGNNFGLILGGEVPHWRAFADDQLACETAIDGKIVGTGKASGLPGGPGEAIAFLLSNLASRGRAAKAGDLISTGAVTGVHDIHAGQSARIDFGAFGDILCTAEMARPGPA